MRFSVGWRVALTYLASGLTFAIVSGWIIGRLIPHPHRTVAKLRQNLFLVALFVARSRNGGDKVLLVPEDLSVRDSHEIFACTQPHIVQQLIDALQHRAFGFGPSAFEPG